MKVKDFAEGALIGVLAGAIGGILFAPQSGEETRTDLVDSFNEIKGKVTEKLAEVEDFTRETYDNAVHGVVATYEEAKKITPEDAAKISDIFDKSFADIEKIVAKDVKKIADATK